MPQAWACAQHAEPGGRAPVPPPGSLRLGGAPARPSTNREALVLIGGGVRDFPPPPGRRDATPTFLPGRQPAPPGDEGRPFPPGNVGPPDPPPLAGPGSPLPQ